MTDKARFLKKNGPNGPKLGRVFCHFLEFGSLVFLEIAYNDSLQQFLPSSAGKTHESIFGGPNLGQTSQNWGPKLGFTPFSQVWFINFP